MLSWAVRSRPVVLLVVSMASCQAAGYVGTLLVLAAGVPAGWLEGPGVAVKELRTPYGRLTYSLRRDENGDVVLDVAGGLQTPPGGLVLTWPGVGAPTTDTRLNGRIVRWDGTELRFHELPARVIVRGGS